MTLVLTILLNKFSYKFTKHCPSAQDTSCSA